MDAKVLLLALAVLAAVLPLPCPEAEGATEFESPDGISYVYGTGGNTHSTYEAWIEAAESDGDVVRIASSLEGYEVRSIRGGALHLPSARTVVIPEFVEDLGEGVFSSCPMLEEIVFMGDRPDIAGGLPDVAVRCLDGTEGWDDSVTPMDEYRSGEDGSVVRYVMIGGSLTVVGGTPSADGRVTISPEVEGIPVTSVGPYAFAGRDAEDRSEVVPRTDVRSVFVPEGVDTLRERSFYYCSGLGSIELPSSLTTVMDESFRACSSLTDAEIPSHVRYLGFESFRHCISLPAIDVPDSVEFMGEGAFKVCSSAVRISVGDGLEAIADWAFSYCGSAVALDLGDGTERVGNAAFYDCSSLASASLPDSLESIGRDAFYQCSSMKSLDLGSRLETIESGAFRGCSSLTEVSVPSSVISIGDRAFAYCSLLSDARFKGDMPLFGSAVFLNDDVTVHCTSSHADSWAGYEGVVVDEDPSENGFPAWAVLAAVVIVAAGIIIAVRLKHRS